MTHNALSKSISLIPMWVVQVVAGLLLTGMLTWGTWASVTSWKHEVRITTTENTVTDVKEDIKEIKEGQSEMNKKLDRILERQAQPRLYGR